jgi:hypothetical protein
MPYYGGHIQTVYAAPAGLWETKDTTMTMKTITTTELIYLMQITGWSHNRRHEEVDRFTYYEYLDGEKREVTTISGYAVVESTLGTIPVVYSRGYEYNVNDYGSFRFHEETDDTWSIEDWAIVDDEGEEIGLHDLYYLMSENAPAEFENIDTSRIEAEISEITDIDIDEDIMGIIYSNMETTTLTIDHAPNIRFAGERLASASTKHNESDAGRWTELNLYKTSSGRYVCHQIGRTQWEGEQDRYSGKVCDTEAEVIEFFGHRWLAKELYEDAGIEDVQTV